ncbi:MAG: OadG family protein [Spirochaetia bacterium]|nr:OadG family protein [Spirochaetia bacterium]MBR4437377.1 OadG family protein [Spirochaetales bacterium]MBR4796631.1 OadG family protein [Spirochaetia bacterium]MBR5017449.1 OadG family protein [Spirochaetia bacterium]MBR5927568.1 OadG family protein [Spirochaetia bacterium]
MDIEVFSYTLVSTVVGLFVVFSFLAILAIVMVILGKWDIAKSKKAAPKAAAAAPAAQAEAPKAESMDWLIAAVAAFVAQDEEPVSAEAWTPSDILRESPWAKAPRVSKRLSGVNR